MSDKEPKLHLSKIIITNDKEPIFNGGVLVENLKIVRVGKKEDFGIDQYEIIDHGESLICPGFINLHTHLLYSNIVLLQSNVIARSNFVATKQSPDASRNKIASSGLKPFLAMTPLGGLFPWLEKLVDITDAWSEKDYISSVNYGINEAISTGTTYIIENTPSYLSAQELAKSPLKALIGLEVFGSDEKKTDEIFEKSVNSILCISHSTLSPHAPYDVSSPLWKKLTAWSEKNNKPLLTHLEESLEEKKWWQEKSGDGINFWKKINKLDSKLKYWKKYDSGIDFLKRNNLLSKNIIAAHLCQASKVDLKILKEQNISLVHCPRSNFYLNNGTANIKFWDELGILWGIGTDSIASNENLDLLEEVRFAINQQKLIYNYTIRARDAFEAITLNSAKILKKDFEIGVLKEGACADLLVYDIKKVKSLCTYNDPYQLLISEIDNKAHLKEVWINGNKAWLREQVLNKI